ncbi:MAG: hypothetical protein M3Q07_24380 [Pseudobdellovibrionaceae bacterium]|nr:hypothetical protein [Pseudobdellovibrionaceae bacterium]
MLLLKNKLDATDYFKVIGLIRSIILFSFRELAGDGLQKSDVQKFLKSDEFQKEVIGLLGSFIDSEKEQPSDRCPFDIASFACQASDQIVQRLKARTVAA